MTETKDKIKVLFLCRAFEDPTLVVGSEEQIMAAFRMLRDDIRAFIETMPGSLKSKNC